LALRRALTVVLLVAAPLCAGADDPARVVQERVKAAFLYKFASYVEWPASAFPQPDTPIVIGVVGAGSLSKELEQAAGGRQVGGRAVQVRPLLPETARDNCCHILYIGGGAGAQRAKEALAGSSGLPVLTVTDSAEHQDGSIINFVVVENRVRFDISREAAERNGLQLRSPLLAVARQVLTP
jgi:hypothetical protein